MKRHHQTRDDQHSRRDARAGVRGGEAFVAMPHVGVVALATLITAKTNPCWASGGLPKEGSS
jgi:hypothetical protein